MWSIHICKTCLFLVGTLTSSSPGSDLDASFSQTAREKEVSRHFMMVLKGKE